ncbi:homeodomain-interacting protein kinase 2-like [Pelobates fuscus]|uniref:homeodomain-interacting protein kinase 2-like n=1 Tax=Pelobates fuscus TaxID=191477 RepID=UPI002FE4DBB9
MEENSNISEPKEHHDDLPESEQCNILCSKTNAYIVQEFLGSGSFGNVVECVKKGTNEKVAIKILHNSPYVVQDAEEEVNILSQLNKEHPDKYNIVKYYEFFQHENYICLVFEMLEISLDDFMEQNNFTPIPVKHIRPIVQQVGSALLKMKSLGIIHTDLKPDNIMMVDTTKHPFKVKLIDFGCALHVANTGFSVYIQTRYYRSPEIILGLPFDEAIDMWSLGCIVAELIIGCPLYPGASEYDQIRYITETQGLPPGNMLDTGAKTELYFQRIGHSQHLSWILKSMMRYESETGIGPMERRKYVFSSLDDMRKIILPSHVESSDSQGEMGDISKCVDLIKEMLTLDPDMRITPIDLSSHPFITMSHLQHFSQSSYVNSCLQAMEVCKQQQEVCPEPPEMETENEQNKQEQRIEEDPEKEYNERFQKINARFITLANKVGVTQEISSQTEAEPVGIHEIIPPAEIEIQDQHAQDGPSLEKSGISNERSNEVKENSEVVALDTQERQMGESDEDDKEEEEEKKQKKRGSRLRRVLRALCCCFPRKQKKVKVSIPETSDVITYQVHGLHNSSSESSTESEAAASTHSSTPSVHRGGLLRKCANGLSKLRMRKQNNSTVNHSS